MDFTMASGLIHLHRQATLVSFDAPKRRAADPKPGPKPRLTKLAKENNISNDQEAEIREAFGLFAETGIKGYAKEKEGVIKSDDVRRCLVALGINVKSSELPDVLETLDPEETGYVPYSPFLALAAIHLHHNDDDDDDDEDQSEEVREAYHLFTDDREGPITLAHLRRIARLLKEDISDDTLRDMLVEANGEGKDGWKRGVDIDAFESVMRRAGVFG
ncbi:hypothetical protein FKW77_006802 [Venturia effusa]|uniref:Calmodulin n=1 Tax=Venturia effusa TaxID=50376 RepID=A0A517LP75_9PEZI|nr:hypothetical protein FKW77_006802 [Venturia effusa]